MSSNQVINSRDTLPAYHSYAMGSLIRKIQFEKPALEARRVTLQIDLEIALICHRLIPESAEYLETNNLSEKQILINESSTKINKVRHDLLDVDTKIKDLEILEEALGPKVNEALLMESSPKMELEDGAFQSERMSHIFITERGKVLEDVENFVLRLADNQFPLSAISSNIISSVVRKIQIMLEKEQVISLVGSLATLSKIRVLKDIKLIANSVNERLKKNANHYVVLTETLLGALFIGVGKSISVKGEENKEDEEETAKHLMVRTSDVFIVSVGAIPIPSLEEENVNMWDTYLKWKGIIKNDTLAGFPIGYRYTEFNQILRQNGIFTDPVEEKLDEEKLPK